MLHLSPAALGFKVRRLQSEIPFSWTVGVVDQHKMWVRPQSFALQFHRAAVLLDKFREHKFQQPWPEWHKAKDIPARDHVDSAAVAGDRRHRG